MGSTLPPPNEAQSIVGTLVSGRYRIHELIGEGGMGAVYRAEHVHMRKVVALKVLHRHMTANDEAVKRFEREAVAAARIEHVNVVQATDFGRLADGSFFLVLEYADGTTLSELLESEAKLAPERAIAIALQIANALEAAHGHGIVHRDLKPDNVILIPQDDGSERVKVLDFGIAKLESDGANLTQMGRVFGTPQYMAPEQAAGGAVDTRADLYALGLILYDMLAGEPAFSADDILALLTQQMTQAPPPLPEEVPEPVREFVKALLVKNPQDRLQSATEAHARLLSLQRAMREPASSRRTPLESTLEREGASNTGASADSAPESASSQRAEQLQALLTTGLGLAKRAHAAGSRLHTLLQPVLDRTPGWVRTLTSRLPARHRRHFEELSPTRASQLLLGVLLISLLLLWLVLRPSSPPTPREAPAAAGSTARLVSSSVEEHLSPASAGPTAAVDPEHERVIQAARRGSPTALYALEQRAAGTRTAREWLALAQGRLRRKEFQRSLDAYRQALAKSPGYAGNSTMLAGIRYFATKTTSHEAMLRFAADHLGQHGSDLLFDVWSATSLKTDATQLAWELLTRPTQRESMSPALRVALDVRNATACEDYAKLLPRMIAAGDYRSYRILKPLGKDSGCGASRRDDCFPCLRKDGQLEEALFQTQKRAGPQYELRSWR